MVTPSGDHLAPTSSPIRFSGANSPAANCAGAFEDRIDQIGRRLGESVVPGQLVHADHVAEQESLFLDRRTYRS